MAFHLLPQGGVRFAIWLANNKLLNNPGKWIFSAGSKEIWGKGIRFLGVLAFLGLMSGNCFGQLLVSFATPPPHCTGNDIEIERGLGTSFGFGYSVYWNTQGIGGTRTDITSSLINANSNDFRIPILTLGPFGPTWIVVDRIGGGLTNADSILVTISPPDASTLSYGGGTDQLCQSSGSELPTIPPGVGGCVNCPIPSLAISAASGIIDPSLSSSGNYQVVLLSGGVCPVNCTTTVTIDTVPDPSFSYIVDTLCVGVDSAVVPVVLNQVGGTFNATPLFTLSLNTLTGEITPSASQAGSYIISHTLPSINACGAQTHQEPITLLPDLDPSFSLPGGSVFCQLDPAVTVIPTNPADIARYTYTVISGGPTLLLNSVTGSITFNGSSPGTYGIISATDRPCVEHDTVTLSVIASVSAAFDYVADSLCGNDSSTVLPLGSYTAGGTFSYTLISGLGPVLNLGTNGEIVPALSDPGDYEITYTVGGSSCQQMERDTIRITPDRIPNFTPGFTHVCLGGAAVNMIPVRPADWQSWSISSISGGGSSVSFDGSSPIGRLDPAASDSGNYAITLITTGGVCGETFSDTVVIHKIDTSTFYFGVDTICQSAGILDSIVLPNQGSFLPRFTVVSPFSLDISPDSGTVNLLNSTPGQTHVVEMAWRNSYCPLPQVDSLYIIEPDTGQFSYLSDTLCTGNPTVTPVSIAIPGGSFDSGLGLWFSDGGFGASASGEIDPNLSTPGIYDVIYTPSGGCVVRDSIQVSIITGDDAFFSYSGFEYCTLGNPTILPDSISTPGGSFSEISGTLLINGATGAITLVDSMAGGPYVIEYNTAASCPTSDTIHLRVTGPKSGAFLFPDGNSYCENDSNPTPIITGELGGGFTGSFGLFFTSGLNSSSTGELDLNLTPPGVHSVIYNPNTGCDAPDSISITVVDTIQTTLHYPTTVLCPLVTTTITPVVGGGTTGTFTEATNTLTLDSIFGVISNIDSTTSGVYEVQYTPDGPCTIGSSEIVNVGDPTSAAFHFEKLSFCQLEPNPIPIMEGTSGGTFTWVGSSTNGFLAIDTLGRIDLLASTPGFFNVTYHVGGLCPDSVTNQIIINPQDNISFAYEDSSFCPDAYVRLRLNTPVPFGGRFYASDELALDSVSGVVDSIPFTPSGNYYVECRTQGSCPDTFGVFFEIQQQDTALFDFNGRTEFCRNQANPFPRILGTPYGRFYSSDSVGCIVNDSTGEVNVWGSTAGNYNLFYSTNGRCQDTYSLNINIEDPDGVSFSYNPDTVCPSAYSNLSMIQGPGFSRGIFSEGSGAMTIDSVSGYISNIPNTAPGTYLIRFTSTQDCPESYETYVTIQPQDDASFYYDSLFYCQNGQDPTPIVSQTTGGYFTSQPFGLVMSDSSNGIIDVSASLSLSYNIPVTYTVTYHTQGACPATSDEQVTVRVADPAAFTYLHDSVCANNFQTVNVANAPVFASFHSLTTPLSVDLGTGQILNIPSTPSGVYQVECRTHSFCPNSFTETFTIRPQDTVSFSYPGSPYCLNGGPALPTLTGTGGGYYLSNPPGLVDSISGEVALASASQGSYQVSYLSQGVCPDTASETLTLLAPEPTNFTLSTSSVCPGVAPFVTITRPAFSSGVFSEASGELTIDSVTGFIDSLLYTPAGSYYIEYFTSFNCPDSSGQWFHILPQDSADFAYPADSVCMGAGNPIPTPWFTAGGMYSIDTAFASQVSVVDSTGEINLTTSSAGTYWVRYETNGVCADLDSFRISLVPQPSPAFDYYDTTLFCISSYDSLVPSLDAVPPFTSTFYCGNPDLVMDPMTGVVQLDSSPARDYQIRHSVTVNGGCPSDTSIVIQIFDAPNVEINYDTTLYCTNGGNAVPDINIVTPGDFICWDPNLVFVDSSNYSRSGVIDLDSSAAGLYDIIFVSTGFCQGRDTFSLEIAEGDNPYFSFADTSFCRLDGNPMPDSITVETGGYFEEVTGSVVFVDAVRGEIDLLASPPGTYVIEHFSRGPCVNVATDTLTIFDNPDPILTHDQIDTIQCYGKPIEFNVLGIGHTAGVCVSFLNGQGDTLRGSDCHTSFRNQFVTDSLPVGLNRVRAFVENVQGCINEDEQIFQIDRVPAGWVDSTAVNLVGLNDPKIEIRSYTNETAFLWYAEASEYIFPNRTEWDTTNTIQAGEQLFITEPRFSLRGGTRPGTVKYTIVPLARECYGDTLNAFLNINPNGVGIYVPEAISPNNDGFNDTWKITLAKELNPEDYYVKVFNRSGGQVAEISPLTTTWGAHDLADGTYWWQMYEVFPGEPNPVILRGGLKIKR